ncbi:hypothetical protein IWX90DRAFT_217062 [Phyllosticta citrichinensis]|uniref:Uncharacterized protein n=1 Tax=Phyllosticta citrichinensis TaxID=1130410 RepID=A0ABR1XTH4_9PEZI
MTAGLVGETPEGTTRDWMTGTAPHLGGARDVGRLRRRGEPLAVGLLRRDVWFGLVWFALSTLTLTLTLTLTGTNKQFRSVGRRRRRVGLLVARRPKSLVKAWPGAARPRKTTASAAPAQTAQLLFPADKRSPSDNASTQDNNFHFSRLVCIARLATERTQCNAGASPSFDVEASLSGIHGAGRASFWP